MVARHNRVKFSYNNSNFVTTKLNIHGYNFDTAAATVALDSIKSSAIINMKRPTSLFELQNGIVIFSYYSRCLPYLKHILYPLTYMLKSRRFKWTSIEEDSWSQAKEICALNIRLIIPDDEDDLVLCTDASKVAASAVLFRVKNSKLQTVSVNSKCFAASDMQKCSYVTETIALAYGLKQNIAYILNCKGSVKIFTDARSLIYCKRAGKQSLIINSSLNYIQNIMSLAKVSIYHLPGDLNICADIFSRAISENLNCHLQREHPISKKWAAVLPPIPDNFSVDNETLFKFLTIPLKSELLDPHDRSMRKLMEPRSVQQWFDITTGASCEERFHKALCELENFNKCYTDSQYKIIEIKNNLNLTKKKAVIDKINKVLDSLYGDIKNTPVYKKVRNSLVEATTDWAKINKINTSTRCNNIDAVDRSLSVLKRHFLELTTDKEKIQEVKEAENELMGQLCQDRGLTGDITEEAIRVTYKRKPTSRLHPSINNLNNLELPLQSQITLEPNETKKLDLGIVIGLPEKFRAVLTRPTDALSAISSPMELLNNAQSTMYNVAITNVTNVKCTLPVGTPIAQIVIKDCRADLAGYSTSSTCTDEETKIEYYDVTPSCLDSDTESINNIESIIEGLGAINPSEIYLGSLKINFCGNTRQNHDEFLYCQELERQCLAKMERSSCRFEATFPHIFNSAHPRRLTYEELIVLQGADEKVSVIRENLTDGHPKYLLRKGIVYRKFFFKNQLILTLMIPSTILRDVIEYTHTSQLHSSKRQTYLAFAEHFFHPQAQREIRRFCNNCKKCTGAKISKDSSIISKPKALKPTKPREGLSVDIVELPVTKDGNRYGLLITDLSTLYVTFYPLKDNDEFTVAHCFEQHLALHGVPRSVYTENTHSFARSVPYVLRKHRITHVKTDIYAGKLTSMERSVKELRRAHRTTILSSRIFKETAWDKIYPIITCKINSYISKYISKQTMYFGETVESSLPVLSDIDIFGPLEGDFEKHCKKFRDMMGRFMGRKKRDKKSYRMRDKTEFCLHELVMRSQADFFGETFKGPYRVMEICNNGTTPTLTLRDLKTGDLCSIRHHVARKLNIDELLTMLPQRFEKDIMRAVESFEHPSKRYAETEIKRDKQAPKPEYNTVSTLLAARLYTVAQHMLPVALASTVRTAHFRKEIVVPRDNSTPGKSSLIKTFETTGLGYGDYQRYDPSTKKYTMYNKYSEPYNVLGDGDDDDSKMITESDIHKTRRRRLGPWRPYARIMCHEFNEYEKGRKGFFMSSYRSAMTGTLLLKRTTQTHGTGKRVRFTSMQVIFYDENEGQSENTVGFDKTLLYFARNSDAD